MEAERSKLRKEMDQLGLFSFVLDAVQRENNWPKFAKLADLDGRLNDARQELVSLTLVSISESSNRLETATRNLQQSSEAQVKVAESQTDLSRSQVKVMKDLLKSSHLLEQLTVYLMVLTGLNIFIIEYGQGLFKDFYGIIGAIGLVATILVMTALGGFLPRLRKLDKSEP